MITVEQVKSLAQKYRAKVVAYRKHLHKNPELSFEEYETSQFIKEEIESLGLLPEIGLGGGTGLTVDIGNGESLLALRADIDALPIQELSEHDYKSQNDGKMHACGHDVHTSCLLGVLHILHELEEHLQSQVRFIFQPGEERLPGGATKMIADGVLKDPAVEFIIGQHVHPEIPVGTVGVKPGPFMASCDEIYITVKGKGGHAALPHLVIDPIQISAQMITALQTVISRRSNPDTPSVLSIGKINSVGGATNVIPAEVKLEGTFRTFDESWREEAYVLIRKTIEGICLANGAEVDLNIVRGYPSLYNNPSLTGSVKQAMISYLGQENVIDLPIRMTAEDFSYYSHEIPACFYRLGTASSDGRNSNAVHTPIFDIDEDALEYGMGAMAWSIISLTQKDLN